ncbi:MAG: hypothetical protein SWI22_02375 [Pseudomonadota bacterium]|nr:hypothetical protein [Pseudomonadota bacterium]
MMQAVRAPNPIGPVTEARIADAFARSCTITAKAAADLIGCDVKTLATMTDDGVIRAVRKGARSSFAYTEGDIRAYLTESAAPCRSISQPRAASTPTISNTRVVDFTALRASKANGRRKK